MMGKRLRSALRVITDRAAIIVGPQTVIQLEAKFRFKKSIDIKHPRKLSEKLCYLEYNVNNPLKTNCSDKYSVRKYVETKGLGHHLVPLEGGPYSSTSQIDFTSLPQRFVIKATFGCKMNHICLDKSETEIQMIKKEADRWIHRGFERRHLEPHYGKLKRRLIIEEYLDAPGGIIDYKFHCFHGKPEFVLVCSDRGDDGSLTLNLYDASWNPIYEIQGIHKTDKVIERPSKLNVMLAICERLSSDFDFVRVDLYQVEEEVYFSELTFTPDGGILSYYTDKFDTYAGGLLRLETLAKDDVR